MTFFDILDYFISVWNMTWNAQKEITLPGTNINLTQLYVLILILMMVIKITTNGKAVKVDNIEIDNNSAKRNLKTRKERYDMK